MLTLSSQMALSVILPLSLVRARLLISVTLFKTNLVTLESSKVLGFVARPVLKTVLQKLDPQQYNGASFLGLNGIVVKSHGNSSAEGFFNAIAQARTEVVNDMINVMARRLTVLSL